MELEALPWHHDAFQKGSDTCLNEGERMPRFRRNEHEISAFLKPNAVCRTLGDTHMKGKISQRVPSGIMGE